MTGAIWISLETAVVQITSLVSFSIIAHYVRAFEFGTMGLLYSIIFALRMLIFDNIVNFVIRMRHPSHVDYSTVFWIINGFGLVLAIGMFASSELIERTFHLVNSIGITRSMSLMLLFLSMGRTHEAWLARNFLFRPLALRGVAGALVGGAAGVAAAILGYGAFALVIQQIVGAALSLALMWTITSWRPTFSFSRDAARALAKLFRTTAPTSLINAIGQNVDVFLVTYYFGPATAGLYSLSKRVRLALLFVATAPINSVSLPALANAQNDPERLRRVFIKGLMLISASGAPVFVGAAAVAPQLWIIAFGQAWLPAAPIFLTLALAGVPASLIAFYDAVFLTQNRPAASLLASTLILSLSALSFGFLPHTRPSLSALPFALPYIIVLPVMTVALVRLLSLDVKTYIAAVGPCLLSSALMFVAVSGIGRYFTFASTTLTLLLLVSVGAVTYVGCLATVGRDHLALIFTIVVDSIRSLSVRSASER